LLGDGEAVGEPSGLGLVVGELAGLPAGDGDGAGESVV
jgi:hypothetical protein